MLSPSGQAPHLFSRNNDVRVGGGVASILMGYPECTR
jgi:hypothetical protein